MNTKEFLQKLSQSDLSKIGHRKILNHLIQNIPVPILTTIIKKGTPIFRGRTEKNVKSFNNEFEISYRTDFGDIKKYGRTNRPHQSVFYASVPQSKGDYPPLTLLTEILPDFFEEDKNVKNKHITIGMWVAKKDFEVADICFSKDYSSNSIMLEKRKLWDEKLKKESIDFNQHIDTLEFISRQFSKKKIKSHWDYKLSSVFFDLIQNEKIHGILYPSVKRDFDGLNLSLIHDVVDELLELKSVCVYELSKEPKKVYPILCADDLGFMNSDFKWIKVDSGSSPE
ncbi:MAG: hypothetical protein COA97_11840 [Flavobacteriales bacterium]|nr:MAG: hypothetical protein COA97_11840 [Flavobacteriales bacterium]